MSKHKEPRKKKVVTTKKNSGVSPTISTRAQSASARTAPPDELIFGKQHYILMAAGAGLVALGMILMMGGDMPDTETWDPDIIYSFRRTVLAPFIILVGLVVEIFAIFKK